MTTEVKSNRKVRDLGIIDQEEKFWSKDGKELLNHFNQNLQGYSKKQAQEKLKEFGPNELEEEEKESIFDKIMEQFGDNLVRILLLAAVISFVIALTEKSEGISSYIEPLVILIILIANAAIGIIQDINADKALDALKKMQKCNCIVRRDGQSVEVDSVELVPGDIVVLNEGEKVPADIRLIEIKSASFEVDQSSLTGESDPKPKDISVIQKEKIVIAEMHNTIFSSTGITVGEAVGIVIYTGMKTQIGKVQKMIQESKEEEEKSPLKIKLENFGDYLSYIILSICVLVWIINYKNFFDEVHGNWVNGCIYYFKISVALAVAAIPEGLPAVITTCLALGSNRLSKQNAIVRKLHSIETLGCTSVICSDKTGTLTTNNMSLIQFMLFGNEGFRAGNIFEVEGTSFNPIGQLKNYNKQFDSLFRLQNECACINNASTLVNDGEKHKILGTPTEGALRVFVEKMSYLDTTYKKLSPSVQDYNETIKKNFKILYTLQFDRVRKCKSVLAVDLRTHKPVILIKGAVEMMIKKAKYIHTTLGVKEINDQNKAELMENISQNFMKKSLRTLAICMKTDLTELNNVDIHDLNSLNEHFKNKENIIHLENNLELISVVGMMDPPRPEVKESILKCHEAGIRVFMITGDELETAKSIGIDIGIIDKEKANESCFYAGDFMNKLTEKEQLDILRTRPKLIFARSEPAHKQELIRLLQSLRYVVAMTGDGVNDAAALSKSNIGIAMGISGVEVAKEASHMVLADDNFATIVKAVEEGRSIYMNMKAFIRYMISSNMGEVASIFISSVFGLPEAFTSIQLLWVNLVTDGPPATALSFNPSEKGIMKKAPRGQYIF